MFDVSSGGGACRGRTSAGVEQSHGAAAWDESTGLGNGRARRKPGATGLNSGSDQI